MLSEDTADCLVLANTAILMRLIEELPLRLWIQATSLQNCLKSCDISPWP